MESGKGPHHNHVMKTLLFLFGLLSFASMPAQKALYYPTSELHYDYQTQRTTVAATGKTLTGYEYTLDYYNHDTMLLKYHREGRMEWQRSYGYNKKLLQEWRYYYHGFKNDSICMEQVSYSVYSGDTSGYFMHYLDRKGNKYQKQMAYYDAYDGSPTRLWYISISRFFNKKDISRFPLYKNSGSQFYDSLGFHSNSAQTGMYIEYHQNGKIKTSGRASTYEYCMQHEGNYPSYPFTGRLGTWTSYDADGVKSGEEIYDGQGMLICSQTFYLNGKLRAKSGYKKRFSEFRIPVRDGLEVGWYDTCINVSTTWYENGTISGESFTTPKGNVISWAWQPNGSPAYFQAVSNGYKPYALFKRWDDKGHVSEYINYSVEYIDTLCYKAVNGKIVALNLRDKTQPMNWSTLPMNYYGPQPLYQHLNKLTTVHQKFHPNGALKSEVHLKDGKRHGAWAEWDSSGVQIVKGNYVNDVPDGAWFEWHPNGRPKMMANYRAGIRDGAYEEYYPSGALKWSNTYANGVPGSGKALSENGTAIRHATYLDAFYPLQCLREQKKYFASAALHYYLLDTAMNHAWVTIPDSVVADYASILVAGYRAMNPAYDLCAPVVGQPEDHSFDAFHSRFAISAPAYTERSKKIMRAFFARHGITVDSSIVAKTPQLGLEKEYIVSYSSTKNMLNKPLIVDSLEAYVTPNSADGKNGYIIPLDANQPAGNFPGHSGRSTLTSYDGYSILILETYVNDPFTYVRSKREEKFIIYNDLTSDRYSLTSPNESWWPL